MKRQFLLLWFLIVTLNIKAQCPTNIEFNNQSQLDSFPILYPNCIDFPGTLTIKGPNITNVLGLSNLKRIKSLDIGFNKRLNNLSGLDHLDTIRSSFILNVNDSLFSLNGLEQLRYVGGSIYMNNNHFLQNLLGLSNLHTVKGPFEIIGTSPLKNLKGLDSLFEAGELYISNNYKLVDYDGIQQLRKVNKLWLLGNYAENVDPFSKLDTIGNMLYIENNAFLKDISAFQNLKEIRDGRVTIRGNDALSDCAAFAICKAIATTPLNVYISNNKSGCNSPSQLSDDCLNIYNFSSVKGKVYVDVDCNGVFDSTDVLLPNHFIRNQETGVPWASTTPNGTFDNLLVPLTTTSIVPYSIIGFSAQPQSDTFVVTNGLQIFSNRDFRYCADSIFHNLSINVTPYHFPVRGFEQHYKICIKNLGVQPENAQITFALTDSIGQNNNQLIYAMGGQIIGSTAIWNIPNLSVFESHCFDLTLYCPPNATLGAAFEIKTSANILPVIQETDTTDNCITLNQTIRGSYDPNDKIVSRDSLYYPDSYLGNWLDYQIRFQNTGTFPATFIEVYDTLETDLDMRTLQMLAASHAYTLSFPAPNVLKWRFDNINLPDSTSDEVNSHGFVSFRIKTMPELRANEIVQNRAGIYFDFNDVVLTNYAQTNFYLPVSTLAEAENKIFQISPNPVSEGEQFQILLDNDFYGTVKFEIISMEGRILEVFQKEKTTKQQVFEIGNLPSGNSFLVRVSDGRSSAVRLVFKY